MGHNGIIAAASRGADTEAPTAPGKPTAGVKCQTTLTLSWAASTDNVGVTGYKIYDDGAQKVDVGLVLTYNLTTLAEGSTSTWTIKAYDAALNHSVASAGTSVTQGVDVTAVSLNATGQASHSAACTDTPFSTTRYISGGDTTISNGETLYTNSCGTTKFNGGNNYYSNDSTSFTVDASGGVASVTPCTA